MARWCAVVGITWVAMTTPALAQPGGSAGDYEWTSRAEVKYGGRSLVASFAGVDPADSQAAAVEIARTATVRRITENYPGGVVDRAAIVVHARLLRDGGSKDVTVRVTLICRTLLIVDEGLRIGAPGNSISIIPDNKEKDRFSTELVRGSTDADDVTFRGDIRTIGRGSLAENRLAFVVWKGRPIDGDQPTVVNLTLRSKEKEHGQFREVGGFGVSIQENDGQLNVEFLPGSNARVVGRPRFEKMGQITFRLAGKDEDDVEIQYDALVTVSDPHAAERRAEAIRAFEQKLDDRPASVAVLTGGVSAKYRNRQGQMLELGVGRTFIVSKDQAAAQSLRNSAFQNRSDVQIVADESAALAALKEVWARSRSTTFKNDNVLDDTVKFSLTPKPGFNNGDAIATFPYGPR